MERSALAWCDVGLGLDLEEVDPAESWEEKEGLLRKEPGLEEREMGLAGTLSRAAS